jgi:RecA-family ATPase
MVLWNIILTLIHHQGDSMVLTPTYDPSTYPIYQGKTLQDKIEGTEEERDPQIENLVYKNTSTMVFAPDGIGESVLMLQIACQSTIKDAVVFNMYRVPEPLKIFYFQMERHEDEAFERVKQMMRNSKVDLSNIAIDTSLQGLFVNSEEGLIKINSRIDWMISQSFKPDIIFIDPLYPLIPSGFKSEDSVFYVTNFLRQLMNKYGCSMFVAHHANRGQRKEKGGGREGEDMYGNRFLSAHFSTVYSIKLTSDESGTSWHADKSTYKNVDKDIELEYDPDSMMSFARTTTESNSKSLLCKTFLNARKVDKKEFTLNDIIKHSKCGHSYARKVLRCEGSPPKEISRNSVSGKILYQF